MHPITALKEHLEEKMQEQGLFRGEVLTVQFVFLTVFDCAICIKHSEVKVVNEEGEA